MSVLRILAVQRSTDLKQICSEYLGIRQFAFITKYPIPSRDSIVQGFRSCLGLSIFLPNEASSQKCMILTIRLMGGTIYTFRIIADKNGS